MLASVNLPRTTSLPAIKLADTSAPLPALGVNVHSMWASSTTYPVEYPMYHSIGASWIRSDIDWENLEPSPGVMSAGVLHEIDGIVAAATANGESSLLTVLDTPAWARPAGTTEVTPPTDPATYASMMAFLAARYSGQGVALEIWNEANNPAFFAGTSPAQYVALACASYADIKAASPSTTVVAGALSLEDISWLSQAYSAGLAGCFDVLSEHPYQPSAVENPDPATWEPTLRTAAIHALMTQYGDGAKPIWFTEIGFTTNTPGTALQQGQVSLATQATLTTRFIAYVAQNFPYVTTIMIYQGKDITTANSGILNADLSPKPVFGAVQSLYAGTTPVDGFVFLPAPVVTGVSPSSGPTTGGTTVVITGTNLTGTTAVAFGPVAATTFTVDSDTQITATAPAEPTDSHNIFVTNPGGTSPTVTGDQFNYVLPAVTAVTPSSGPAAGGTTVVISGTNFTGATAVAFGPVAATTFTVNSDTQITATAPAEAAGNHDITVTTPGGITAIVAADQFSALLPAVTAVTPSSGPTAGGTTVVITGTNFTGTTAVAFGPVAATTFTVNSDTNITATTPAEAAGSHDITVTTPGGTTAVVAADQFSALLPVLTAITASSGPTTGGTTVVITGTNFTGATAVAFGPVAATTFTVNSATQITATTPAEPAGSHNVFVTNPEGSSPVVTADQFSAVVPAAPAVTSVSPSSGPTAGGTTVVITGTNFTGTTAVAFGPVAATTFTVNSATNITATTPAEAAGNHDISVTTPGGSSPVVAADQFNALLPALTAVSPSSGPTAGGTTVVITGTNFTGATAVAFGPVAATTFTVNSDTNITATAPAEAAGSHDITVTTPGGTTAVVAADQFSALLPALTAVSPNSGPTAGGTTVVITGTNFTGATAVAFGPVAATTFTVNSDTNITATTPAEAAGSHNITVTTPGGTTAVVAADQFSALLPALTAVSPNSGPTTGGTTVVITGTNFTGATAVAFGPVAATTFTVNSATQITATTPAEPAGSHNVFVTNPEGSSPVVTADQFSAVVPAAPAVTSVSPKSGPTAGGTTVVITGTNFTGATAVAFGPVAATTFTVNSATQITATTPAEPAGSHDISVTTPGGSSPVVAADQFSALLPALTAVSPKSGPTTGGTTVVITGTNFTGATAVAFGPVAATTFTVNSATNITATTPAEPAGSHNITVTTPGGTTAVVAADQFSALLPALTAVSPNSGPTTGGTTVVITGTNFTGATAVAFGPVAATTFTVNSATQITATTPAEPAGSHNVFVTNPEGSSPVVTADQFSAVVPAALTAITPKSGPTAGGTTVVITGTNFTRVIAVAFGPVAAKAFTVNSATHITATAPAESAGNHNISITTPSGTTATVAADQFSAT